MQQQLDELMARTGDIIAKAGHTASKSDSDGSWYFAPSGDNYRHVLVRDGLFVVGQVDRNNPEYDVFTSEYARDTELFIVFWLCSSWRSQRRLPKLLTVPVPVTIDKVAPGFSLERDGSAWVLREAATGAERRTSNASGLVHFSHYVNMSPEELREACLAPGGKPPFFPLT
ncbi:Imm61 family immunity protein [Arthrobacter sp. NPDC056691]|uniref:Imm61 family immunity protein n=1 Tax=Arthrobacter sp. NPDC056691 TaxID=3345913 RepID=UPI003670D7EA